MKTYKKPAILEQVQKAIESSYPNAILIDIEECFYPEDGWVNTSGMINPYRSMLAVGHSIETKISRGVTHFNFKIEDEFGMVRFPDFSVKEIKRF